MLFIYVKLTIIGVGVVKYDFQRTELLDAWAGVNRTCLTNECVGSHKRDIGKQCRATSDAT